MARELHGHIILDGEGCVDRAQRLNSARAISREGPSPRLVVTGQYGVQLGTILSGTNDPRVPAPTALWAEEGIESGVAVPYLPGISLAAILAQTREQGAFLAEEAAAAVVVDVAHAAAAIDRARRVIRDDPFDLEAIGPPHVRVGFEGGLQIFPAPLFNERNDIIGVGDFSSVFRRSTERGLSMSPEQILGADLTPASDVYLLGALLFVAAGGTFPWRDQNPLEFLSAFNDDPTLPHLPHVAPEINVLIVATTARRPADRLQDPAALIAALEHVIDVAAGRGALAAAAANLFPEAQRTQLAFVEEAPFFEITVVDRNPAPVHPAPRPRDIVWLAGRLRCDAAPVSHGEFARYLAITGHARPAHYVDVPEIAAEPIIVVSNEDAAAYATWVGGRLPSDDEWRLLASNVYLRNSIGRVWEWTATPMNDGHVVRGGPWRDQGGPGLPDNRSWENQPAADVGFRVFYDR